MALVRFPRRSLRCPMQIVLAFFPNGTIAPVGQTQPPIQPLPCELLHQEGSPGVTANDRGRRRSVRPPPTSSSERMLHCEHTPGGFPTAIRIGFWMEFPCLPPRQGKMWRWPLTEIDAIDWQGGNKSR